MKKTILCISILSILGISGLSFASDNSHVVRTQVDEKTSKDNIESNSITEPANLKFNETGDELKGNVSTSANIIAVDSFNNEIGYGKANEDGDFSIVLEPSVSSGEIMYIIANKNAQATSISIIVPEHIGKKDIVTKPKSYIR